MRALDTTHDIVIVSFHGGAEGSKALHVPYGQETFYGENRGHLREFTHTVIDAGADLVWGHGPHVLRGMEVYKDRLIAYSLGNFATYGRFNTRGQQGLGVCSKPSSMPMGHLCLGRFFQPSRSPEGSQSRCRERSDRCGSMLSAEDFQRRCTGGPRRNFEPLKIRHLASSNGIIKFDLLFCETYGIVSQGEFMLLVYGTDVLRFDK